MGNLDFPKQFDLIYFTRILKPGIKIGKYLRAVLAGHFIQRPVTSLGKNDGLSCTNSGQILYIWLPPGTNDIFIGIKQRVK